jgi:hypothetical protein
MLSNKTIQVLADARAHGLRIGTDTCKTGTFEFPIVDAATLEELEDTCIIKFLNRMLKTDYRNRANKPSNQKEQLKLDYAKIAESDLTDAEKFEAGAKLLGAVLKPQTTDEEE